MVSNHRIMSYKQQEHINYGFHDGMDGLGHIFDDFGPKNSKNIRFQGILAILTPLGYVPGARPDAAKWQPSMPK